jgi:hypothetical protein
MRGLWSACVAVVLLWGGDPAQGQDPVSFLLQARKKHYDPRAGGLKGYRATFTLRESKNPRFDAHKGSLKFTSAWSAPDSETLDMKDVPEPLRGPLEKLCQGLWPDITGTHVFDDLRTSGNLGLSKAFGNVIVRGIHPKHGNFIVLFREPSFMLSRFELVRNKRGTGDMSYYGFQEREQLLHIMWREDSLKEKRQRKITYSEFRKLEKFDFPTVVAVEDGGGRTSTFEVRYDEIETRPLQVSLAEVKKAVSAFKKGWRKWSEKEKTAQIEKLAELPHDLASSTVAKYGLSDKSEVVRKETAVSLGEMGRKNVVPGLIRALRPNERNLEVSLALFRALGKIGDPKAVPVLVKDLGPTDPYRRIYMGKDEAVVALGRARVEALGDIRSKSSVDALLKVWQKTGHLGGYVNEIIAALRKLTGQNYGPLLEKWKEWWAASRAGFRFE